MMKLVQFYKCQDCDSVVLEMSPGKQACEVPSKLNLIVQSNEETASMEKHKPVVTYRDTTLSVSVSAKPHPMTAEHYIQWIYVQTLTGGMIRQFSPGDEPKAVFTAQKDNIAGVYAYCNLHGLWKADPQEFVFHELICSAEFPDGCIET